MVADQVRACQSQLRRPNRQRMSDRRSAESISMEEDASIDANAVAVYPLGFGTPTRTLSYVDTSVERSPFQLGTENRTLAVQPWINPQTEDYVSICTPLSLAAVQNEQPVVYFNLNDFAFLQRGIQLITEMTSMQVNSNFNEVHHTQSALISFCQAQAGFNHSFDLNVSQKFEFILLNLSKLVENTSRNFQGVERILMPMAKQFDTFVNGYCVKQFEVISEAYDALRNDCMKESEFVGATFQKHKAFMDDMHSFIKEWDTALRTSYVQTEDFVASDEYVHTLGNLIEKYRKDMTSSIEHMQQ